MDVRAQQARQHNRDAAADAASAAAHRAARDRLIRALRAEDPARWTYRALAGAVGCSPELVAYVVRQDPPPGTPACPVDPGG